MSFMEQVTLWESKHLICLRHILLTPINLPHSDDIRLHPSGIKEPQKLFTCYFIFFILFPYK